LATQDRRPQTEDRRPKTADLIYSSFVSHPLVLALFPDADKAEVGARAMHALGIGRQAISVVARNHREENALARVMDATPGADLEDSRPAARFGELSAVVIAATASVMPGVGPLVAAGPLAAELGEVVGHLAGGLAGVLEQAGVGPDRAASWQESVARGQPMLGIHVAEERVGEVGASLRQSGATEVAVAQWEGDLPG
jgi:hypothetical protein